MNNVGQKAGDFANRPVGLGLLMASFALATGCGSLIPNDDGTLTRHVLDTKYAVERLSEEQAQSKRTIDYRLETLEGKVQTRNDVLNSNLGEIDKRIRQQAEETASLKREIAELAFQIDTLIKKLELQPSRPSKETTEILNREDSLDQLYNEAFRQYSLGNYEPARQGFEQALAGGLFGDKAVQAQFYLAESLNRESKLDQAEETYTKLITSNPSHTLAWQSLERLAEIQEKQGRPADALSFYKQIELSNPTYEHIERVKEKIKALEESAPPAENAPPAQAPPTP